MTGRHFQSKIQHRKHKIRHNNIDQSAAVEFGQYLPAQRTVNIIVEQDEPA